MADQPSPERARRCPTCGALVSTDAAWCGQCFAALGPADVPAGAAAPEPEPGPGTPARPEPDPAPQPQPQPAPGPAEAEALRTPDAPATVKLPTWPCPTCGHDNAIALTACEVCGTSFAELMRMDERPPDVDPTSALLWSLIFPGLGHRKVGRPIDGLARGVLFAMLAGLAVLLALTGVSGGMLSALLGLFVLLALAVYLGSAYEAYRLAQGGEPLVSPRTLMWVTVGVVMLAVLMLAMSVIGTTKR